MGKKFLLETDNVERDSFFWNMLGSMLISFQSVIMLMLLTRTLGLADAGIFTIAYANANLFLTVGKYGMRSFQVSDVKEQFTFAEYRRSRYVTTAGMLVAALVYILYASWRNSYSPVKALSIFWMCCFKAVDAIEGIYHGEYQRQGRLDVAAKALTVRAVLTMAVFGFCILWLKDLLYSLILTTIFTVVLFCILIERTSVLWREKRKTVGKGNVRHLLKLCFPLFAGSFLSFYIGNAPKYAIDAVLTDELQACYGFIAMPVFVIGMLNGFIFNPLIHQMSVLWNQEKYREFYGKVFKQILIIGGITLICIMGAFVVGVPALSWLYNTDLSPYRVELIIMLLGGGFLGLSGFLCAVLTIIRYQRYLIWGYGLVALIAFFVTKRIVIGFGIHGATMVYTGLMALLSIVFLGFLLSGIKIQKNS